jgi:membrane-associated phospholipid phosphatase
MRFMSVDSVDVAANHVPVARTTRLSLLRTGLVELLVAATGYVAYSLSCGAVHGRQTLAFDNADRVIAFERWMRILVERQVQAPELSHGWLVQLFNGIYIWGHLPLIIAVAVWLFAFHRSRYRIIRNAVLISGGIALIIFYLLPVAPPRLVPSLHITDTAALISPVYDTVEPKVFFNAYAAIPSMHIAWDLLMGIALVWCSRRAVLRAFGALLPFGMLVAVVVTGNHYIVDGLAGALVGLAGLALAMGMEHWKLGHGITNAEPARQAGVL